MHAVFYIKVFAYMWQIFGLRLNKPLPSLRATFPCGKGRIIYPSPQCGRGKFCLTNGSEFNR